MLYWQLVCHSSEVANPGEYYTFNLHGQDMFIVRHKDGELSAFYNVCPHRGHRLLELQGKKSSITCPHHAWTFNLDGSLRGARNFDCQALKSDGRFDLKALKVDQLVGFIFVNADLSALSLAKFAPGLEAQIHQKCTDLNDFILDQAGDEFAHSYQCQSNWKVMLDNYLECYHCQMAYPELDEMMDISDSRFTRYQNATHQHAPAAGRAENKAFPLDLDYDILVGNFWFLFPNTIFGQFPDVKGFYVFRFDPITLALTERKTMTLKTKEPTDAGAIEWDQLRAKWTQEVVSQEDKSLCENVQRGMQQKAFKHGWHVTNPNNHEVSEHAIRYFHTLYVNRMENLQN